jgi:hypothetical protein
MMRASSLRPSTARPRWDFALIRRQPTRWSRKLKQENHETSLLFSFVRAVLRCFAGGGYPCLADRLRRSSGYAGCARSDVGESPGLGAVASYGPADRGRQHSPASRNAHDPKDGRVQAGGFRNRGSSAEHPRLARSGEPRRAAAAGGRRGRHRLETEHVQRTYGCLGGRSETAGADGPLPAGLSQRQTVDLGPLSQRGSGAPVLRRLGLRGRHPPADVPGHRGRTHRHGGPEGPRRARVVAAEGRGSLHLSSLQLVEPHREDRGLRSLDAHHHARDERCSTRHARKTVSASWACGKNWTLPANGIRTWKTRSCI